MVVISRNLIKEHDYVTFVFSKLFSKSLVIRWVDAVLRTKFNHRNMQKCDNDY